MNTRNRRASALGFALAALVILPAPDGLIDAADRQQTAFSYAGIASGQPVIAPPDIVPLTVTLHRTVELDASLTRALTVDATFQRTVTVDADLTRTVELDATVHRTVTINVER